MEVSQRKETLGKSRITWFFTQLFDKMKFHEDTKYLVHFTKSCANLPDVRLGGNLRESTAALQINSEMSCCVKSGRHRSTAFLFQRAAAVPPTLYYYRFPICFSIWFCSLAQICSQNPFVILISTNTIEMGKAFSAETCTNIESSQHFHSIHLFKPPVSLQSELFCSCRINPLAHNSFQKKNPLNSQLNFSHITDEHFCVQAPDYSVHHLHIAGALHSALNCSHGSQRQRCCCRPHGNHAHRSHGDALQRAGRNTGEETCSFSTCKNTFKSLKCSVKKEKRQY